MRWLHLQLHGPMGSFGGEAVDAHGVIRNMPAKSMLTGLVANALGWTRTMRKAHQDLQDRIVFGAVWERDETASRLTDYQTAQLQKSERAWTTHGTPALRGGGPSSYLGAEQLWRDYHADLQLSVVLRLAPAGLAPTLEEVASALQRPARPLFLGRKACLPSRPILAGWVDAISVAEAVRSIVRPGATGLLAAWPDTGRTPEHGRLVRLTDERNWQSGLHGGERRVVEARISGADAEA